MGGDNGGEWVSISEAARRLGRSRQAIQRRIGRGTLETRTETVGNRPRLLVRLPSPLPEPVQQPVHATVAEPEHAVQLARLEERVAQQDRLIAHLEAELARRRWPGLKVWWRRVWEGEG